MTPIETQRLLIRPLQPSDVPALVALWADPAVTRHMGGPRDPAKVRATLDEEIREGQRGPFGLRPVVERASGRVVGDCGLVEKDVEGRAEIEVIYVFAADVWGRGYATEAAAALRDAAVRRLGLTRLIALIDPDNVASARVAEKIGMRRERETVRPGGTVRVIYAMEMKTTPDYLLRNRRAWDRWAAKNEDPGRRAWATDAISWGIWGIPEVDLRALPDVAGKDVIELGCGTAYFSAWMHRRGARPVGIDNSPAQLKTARALQEEFGRKFSLVQAAAEAVPLADASFDLVLSEYGASLWADPYRWIPEASRLLRPGGQLIFMVNAAILMLCAPDDVNVPAGDRMIRDYFGMHRFDWPEDDEGVEFHLGYGDWIRLLRRHGFEVEDLIEVRPPEGATTRYEFVTLDWARRWPAEEVWKARKRR